MRETFGAIPKYVTLSLSKGAVGPTHKTFKNYLKE